MNRRDERTNWTSGHSFLIVTFACCALDVGCMLCAFIINNSCIEYIHTYQLTGLCLQ